MAKGNRPTGRRPGARRQARRPKRVVHHSVVAPEGIEATDKTLTSHDGVKIFYQTVGEGDDVIVLANGLGGRLYSWEPILRRFAGRYRFLTWDYRGLFESGAPEKLRQLSLPHHADDLRALLDAENVRRATLIGWSMGVQVSLEFTAFFPERVKKLVLVNGTYGHVLQTGFQPLFRVPYVNRLLHELIAYFQGRPDRIERLASWARNGARQARVGALLSLAYGHPRFKAFYQRYINDLFAHRHLGNYLRLFQELDAHSAYHYLRHISQPALVVWGDLDFLTPGYQSREMLRKLPNAEGFHIWTATHFVLLEYPERILPRLEAFLSD